MGNLRECIVNELFYESFMNDLRKIGFEPFEMHSLMRFHISDGIYLVFYNWDNRNLFFGFWSDNEIPEKERDILEMILNCRLIEHFSDSMPNWGPTWLVKSIKILDLGDVPIYETIDFFTKFLIEKYTMIKEDAMGLLNN